MPILERGATAMFETLDKMVLAGLGALSLTRERAEQIFDELVQRGQAERPNKPAFVKDLMDSAEKTRKTLEDLVARQVQQGLGRLNLATKDDLARLEARLEQLLQQRTK
jgi:polyhydroxyalkanoate synthesis regulator phasin